MKWLRACSVSAETNAIARFGKALIPRKAGFATNIRGNPRQLGIRFTQAPCMIAKMRRAFAQDGCIMPA
jgi:hypothetical protein